MWFRFAPVRRIIVMSDDAPLDEINVFIILALVDAVGEQCLPLLPDGDLTNITLPSVLVLLRVIDDLRAGIGSFDARPDASQASTASRKTGWTAACSVIYRVRRLLASHGAPC